MHRFYPNSTIACQFREIVKCFGSKPFVYPEARALVPGPATLKRMEDYGWLVVTRQVKVNRNWCTERQVVPPMKQWVDELEEEERKKQQENQQQAGETPDGDVL